MTFAGAGALGGLIGAMLGMVVGYSLLPVVSSSAGAAQTDTNLSTSAKNLANLGPLIFVIIIIVGALGGIGLGLYTEKKRIDRNG